MQSISLQSGQGLGNSYSCTGFLVYIRAVTYFTSTKKGDTYESTRELNRFYDCGWVAKVNDRVYGLTDGLV
jgi:hypothetical protein